MISHEKNPLGILEPPPQRKSSFTINEPVSINLLLSDYFLLMHKHDLYFCNWDNFEQPNGCSDGCKPINVNLTGDVLQPEII